MIIVKSVIRNKKFKKKNFSKYKSNLKERLKMNDKWFLEFYGSCGHVILTEISKKEFEEESEKMQYQKLMERKLFMSIHIDIVYV